jgi:hypothetical protein
VRFVVKTGAFWDQEAIPPARCVLGSRSDPARKRPRPQVRFVVKTGAFWDQEGAFYGQERGLKNLSDAVLD